LARLRKALGLDDAKPASVFMPGAEFGPAKQWPVSHFAELARQRVAQGEQVWILGSDRDHRVGQLIADLAGADSDVHNLCGRTQLVDAVDLIADARVAVTNDSGLMHVAAAVNTPLVALYGSSTPQHTPPLADRAAILYLGISCAPCFKRECPLGHTRCLHDISPQQVTQSIKGLDA
jgi:heptosyltransferase-2